jgi:hypothetical protein
MPVLIIAASCAVALGSIWFLLSAVNLSRRDEKQKYRNQLGGSLAIIVAGTALVAATIHLDGSEQGAVNAGATAAQDLGGKGNHGPSVSIAPLSSGPALPPEDAYIKELRDHMGLIRITAAGKFGDSLDSVQFVLGQIERWATLYRQGSAAFTLMGKDEKVRHEFKAALADMQAKVFPMLRDKYGPAAREKLWIANGSARTFGSGYRTVEFVASAFVLNRNIAEIQEKAFPLLMKLRFTSAIYRWAEGQSGTQYKLTPPSDRAVGTWDGAAFVEVE